jgi:hypothetical protein
MFFLPLLACCLQGEGVMVRFDPASVETGPFPTDFLTVADPAQKTGLRVNLPSPMIADLNRLDGFNIQPRIHVNFSAAINPDTLRGGVFLVALENLTNEEYGLERDGQVMPINEVIYDPDTITAYAKPDAFLDQHRRHAIVVTDAIRDRDGDPVVADPAFIACIETPAPSSYCDGLRQVVDRVAPLFAPRRIVAASAFTTLSATDWMEKARSAIQSTLVNVHPAGPTNIVDASDIVGISLKQQTGANPARFDEFNATVPSFLLQGVGRIAFLSFSSPNFLDSRQVIPSSPTGAPVLSPSEFNDVGFHVFLPSAQKPETGYPVVIFGHGFNDSRFGGPTVVAGTLARAGFAVVAMNAVGHGYGPESSITILETNLRSVELPAGGRGVDLNGDGAIDSDEGCLLTGSPPFALRDCLRQTALDMMQLVRVIRGGLDADGDGTSDLDGDRIYYAGQSLGALYGTLVLAVEPAVRAGALNVGGATVVNIARWSPRFRSEARSFLSALTPPLLNRGDDFDENYVLRYRPVRVNDVPGAVAIQNFFEEAEWFQAVGDPAAFAPHLFSSTLPGVPIKQVLWQFAKGDRTVPNPASTYLIRAANMRPSTIFYRHDLARAVAPDLDENPHTFLVNITSAPGALIALSAQQQIADFLASDGKTMPATSNVLLRSLFQTEVFEVPDFLTEDLNF